MKLGQSVDYSDKSFYKLGSLCVTPIVHQCLNTNICITGYLKTLITLKLCKLQGSFCTCLNINEAFFPWITVSHNSEVLKTYMMQTHSQDGVSDIEHTSPEESFNTGETKLTHKSITNLHSTCLLIITPVSPKIVYLNCVLVNNHYISRGRQYDGCAAAQPFFCVINASVATFPTRPAIAIRLQQHCSVKLTYLCYRRC